MRRDSSKNWEAVANHLDGRLLNVHTSHDKVLKWLYKAGETRRQNPAGLKPIKATHHKIVNIDADHCLSNGFKAHFRYQKVLAETVGLYSWPE